MDAEELKGTMTFTEDECCAIAKLILNLYCTDHNLVHLELVDRKVIYNRLGVTFEHERSKLTLNEAIDKYREIDAVKRDIVNKALHEAALTDGSFCTEEMDFIEQLCGSLKE